MNKRITSIVLSLVMLFTMLATAVPVFAATPVALKVTADTTSAHPGDTINYKVFVGAVTNMGGLEFRLNIPSGLTIVDDSISIPTGLETTIDSDGAIVVPKSGNGYKWSYSAQMTGYTGSSDLVILNFACTVDDGASGDKIVTINVDTFFDNDPPYPELDYTVTPATVNVTAAPVSVTGVTIDETLSVNIGQTKTPSFTVAPAEATNKTVSFTSDNPAVATVNATTGEVTGVSKGTATITVKTADGNFTDTCTVTVSCAHSSLQPVAEKASNCTDKGWDAYKKCNLCGKLFDVNGNPISEIPYRPLNNDHDFNTSEWGYKEADGHAHVCSRNAEHHDTVQPHTPDHEGGATYDYAVKCSVCNYVIEPQLEAGNIRIEVPFKLDVKKTGEMDPGKETFKFVVERFGAPVEYVLVQDTVETEGEKTYDGKFIFTIGANQAGNLSEGFVIRQVKGNAEGWTYDETKFYAIPMFADTYTNVAGWRFLKYDENAELDYNNPIEEISFTNSYNAKKPVTPPAPQPESPKTGDSNMAGLWIALLFVSAASLTGTTLYSRKKKANNR